MAPNVLGIISENTRINIVRIIEATVNHSLPSLLNSEPTPAAPTVCEIVLSVSIAASGTSMSSFNSLSLLPLLRSSLLYISM